MRPLATLVLILAMSAFAGAEEMHQEKAGSSANHAAATNHEPAGHGAVGAEPQPDLPASAAGLPVLLMVIGGLFVAAAAIGPIVHANAPEEVPPMHSHDEPPGSSHHHGSSGIINPSPEHTHGHGHGHGHH